MKSFLAVCLGGAVGTGARYLVNLGATRWLGTAFPYGTATVNVVGSFLLGLVIELSLRGAVSPEWRAVLASGVMGGFTTYSSFNHELLAGFDRGAWLWSAAYALATFVGALAAGAAGMWAGRSALSP